jgi:hypothetical protein
MNVPRPERGYWAKIVAGDNEREFRLALHGKAQITSVRESKSSADVVLSWFTGNRIDVPPP